MVIHERLVCRATGQAGAETLKDCAPCLNCDHEAPIVAGCQNPEDSQSRRIYGEGGRARRWQHGKAPAQSRPAC